MEIKTTLGQIIKIPTRKYSDLSRSVIKTPTRKIESNFYQDLIKEVKQGTQQNFETKDNNIENILLGESKTVYNQRNKEVYTTVSKPRNAQIDVTAECLPKSDMSDFKTPFKVFVYDLPAYFNFEVQRTMTDEKKHAYCYNLDYCGTGEELFQTGFETKHKEGNGTSQTIMSIRNTHQFALETVLHYKMLNSPYRTLDPNKADVFYIPGYSGLKCLQFTGESAEFVDKVFHFLRANYSDYFLSGKPQIMALSKIQREQGYGNCPTLMHPDTENVTFVGIEKEGHPQFTSSQNIKGKSLIVVPYPSYVHFLPNINDKTVYEFNIRLPNLMDTKFYINVPDLQERKVLLFLAAGTRRSNGFRAQLLDQFLLQTKQSYEEVANNSLSKGEEIPKQVMLITSECLPDHRTTTIPWMLRSKYCLQPPGDSPTRKSIYDSILSGCIPVLFTNQYKVEYPFQNFLNYSDFTVTIDENQLQVKGVFDLISEIHETKTEYLHRNIRKIAKWFQYSVSNAEINNSDDAFTLILHEIAIKHRLY